MAPFAPHFADPNPLAGLSSNAFRTVLEIDTLGTFNTFKSTIDELVKTKGSLIAISATLHYTGMPLQAHVSAAKAGVDALIRAVAVEYGPRGVRANVSRPFMRRGGCGAFRRPSAFRDARCSGLSTLQVNIDVRLLHSASLPDPSPERKGWTASCRRSSSTSTPA
jgi:NAD(P)-dependent dehydrogenase (short-subunit alcohol dehydrogenase family)